MNRRIDPTSYFRQAFILLLIEGAVLLITVVLLGAGGGHAANRCWFGLGGPGPVKVLNRYYRVGDDVQPVDEHREWNINQQEIGRGGAFLGVELALNKECHCSDLFAEIYYYTANDAGRLVEAPFVGRLVSSNGNINRLEGKWVLPPPAWYRIQIRLACENQPQEYIDIFWYATMIIRK